MHEECGQRHVLWGSCTWVLPILGHLWPCLRVGSWWGLGKVCPCVSTHPCPHKQQYQSFWGAGGWGESFPALGRVNQSRGPCWTLHVHFCGVGRGPACSLGLDRVLQTYPHTATVLGAAARAEGGGSCTLLLLVGSCQLKDLEDVGPETPPELGLSPFLVLLGHCFPTPTLQVHRGGSDGDG